MSAPVIEAEGLSKVYRIGLREKANRTFGEALVDSLTGPIRRLRRLGTKVNDGDDSFWALRDVSFAVQPGEVVGVIGRNGAGKSTLLKILSRITEPTRGRARIHGRVGSLLEVGTGFHPELTGRENIYLNGAILGMKRVEIRRRFDEIVAFSEISKFLDTPVKRYSSGMYVRLAFAVAAHLEPEILIVDEVLAVGDAEFQAKCLKKMRDVTSDGGRTVLFVSHNMTAIRNLCGRAILLEGGQVSVIGDATEATERYLEGLTQGVTEGQVVLPAPRAYDGKRARVKALRTLNTQGEATTVFGINDSLVIEADYEGLGTDQFTCAFDVCVYHLRSQEDGTQLRSRGPCGTVRLTLRNISLVEGLYWITTRLGNQTDVMEDIASRAIAFHVVNRGEYLHRLSSVLCVKGQWEHIA